MLKEEIRIAIDAKAGQSVRAAALPEANLLLLVETKEASWLHQLLRFHVCRALV